MAAAREALTAGEGGSVVNIASIGGLLVEPGIGIYNVTKAALMHLTRTLAR
ncbi:MAG TPA: SDR family oxidoreductase, partial [Iamia sp.]